MAGNGNSVVGSIHRSRGGSSKESPRSLAESGRLISPHRSRSPCVSGRSGGSVARSTGRLPPLFGRRRSGGNPLLHLHFAQVQPRRHSVAVLGADRLVALACALHGQDEALAARWSLARLRVVGEISRVGVDRRARRVPVFRSGRAQTPRDPRPVACRRCCAERRRSESGWLVTHDFQPYRTSSTTACRLPPGSSITFSFRLTSPAASCFTSPPRCC